MPTLVALALLWTASLHTSQIAPSPPDDYGAAWNSVGNAIRTRYYAREKRRSEVGRLLAEYAPRARTATSREAFDATVGEMIAKFGDSHFDFFTRSEQGFYLMDNLVRTDAAPMPTIGAWFRSGSGGAVVQMVLNGSEAERVGLRVGDQVVSADGKPFSPVDSLAPHVGGKIDLQVRRGATTLTVSPAVVLEPVLTTFLRATRDSVRVYERDGKRIGYIHLWTQASPEFASSLREAVRGKLKGVDALVLDIRDGFGGGVAGYPEVFLAPRAGASPPYSGPLAVLINGGTRSAKELLSLQIKNRHRGMLIGSTTAGNVLGANPIRVSEWAYLEIPAVDIIVDGVRLEGKGVAPDIAVPPMNDGSGGDLALERALQWLGQGSVST